MLGTTDPQTEILDADAVCGHLVAEGSIHRHLAEVGDKLFTDQDFADLFDPARGRRSIPPSLLAKVALLQSLEGTSDRETVERVRCDLRWKVALHLPLTDEGFHPTVLTYFRERLRNSDNPRRIFERFKQVAAEAGLLTNRGARVLDSTPVLSAVQTQDTVSLIKGAIRRLLILLSKTDPDSKSKMEGTLKRTDYASPGKPAIDWDDEDARNHLVDEMVTDALAALGILEGDDLPAEIAEAAELLAMVAGQDVERDDNGKFHIRRGVAKDRVVSTVDPEVRHGRKSKSGAYDGYKANIAIDPDTELITEVEVTPANAADSLAVEELLPELKDEPDQNEPLSIVADSAYGSGVLRQTFEDAGAEVFVKALPVINSHGGFPRSDFEIDLDNMTATCPAGITTDRAMALKDGSTKFEFPAATCNDCALKAQCTTSSDGRSVTLGPHEALLERARILQQTDEFKKTYNGKRPTVERVISRLVRNGCRKARYRGRQKVTEQFVLRAAALNLMRMMRLGIMPGAENAWALG